RPLLVADACCCLPFHQTPPRLCRPFTSLYLIVIDERVDVFSNVDGIAMSEREMHFRMGPHQVERQHSRVGPELPPDGLEWRRLGDFVAMVRLHDMTSAPSAKEALSARIAQQQSIIDFILTSVN